MASVQSPRTGQTRDKGSPSTAMRGGMTRGCEGSDPASHPGSAQILVPDLVPALVRQYADLWWDNDAASPDLGPRYTPSEQGERETQLERFQRALASEARRVPRTASARRAAKERLLSAFRTVVQASLGPASAHTDILLSRGLADVGSQFAQMARRFDPDVSASDIFQALRNVWTMNGLQMLLGVPVRLTPAVFAYSMLYPYSDNYLDDPTVSPGAKGAFNERFALRLSGEPASAANGREEKIYSLVGMIERQFDRSECPAVFESLRAIHRAQCKSVQLLHRDASPYEVDVLGISFEKGGTSVLADAYLVAGSLNRDEASCAFGWGAFVQLVDDLQDVEEDTRSGLQTIFSQTAHHWPLDAGTDRALSFGIRIVEQLDCFRAPTAGPIKELMRQSVAQLLIRAAGGARRFYTEAYLRQIEPHSPCRFSFLTQRREQAAARTTPVMGLIEAFASVDDQVSPLPFPVP